MLAIIVFIIILGVLVFVHELGHFLVARRNGIKAEEFGFGFPPRVIGVQFFHGTEKEEVREIESVDVKMSDMKTAEGEIIQEMITEKFHTTTKEVPVKKWRIIWGKDRDDEKEINDLAFAKEKNLSGGTIYSLNWFPIGGFVRIKGEDGDAKNDPESFAGKSAWIRVKVLVAGVLMNFIFAWLFLSMTFMLGAYKDVTGENAQGSKVLVEGIEDNSPAQSMDLRIGDVLIKGNDNVNFNNVEDVQNFVSANKGQSIILHVERGKQLVALSGTPREQAVQGQGALGISSLGEVVMVRYSFFESLWKGIIEIGGIILMMLEVLRRLVSGNRAGLTVTGVVGIAAYTGQVIPLGFSFILRFAAILSVNLGIVNALPFPALDGGRILFILIEKIKGSPVSQKVEQIFHTVGFFILILLMLVVTYFDFLRFNFFDKIKGIF